MLKYAQLYKKGVIITDEMLQIFEIIYDCSGDWQWKDLHNLHDDYSR